MFDERRGHYMVSNKVSNLEGIGLTSIPYQERTPDNGFQFVGSITSRKKEEENN